MKISVCIITCRRPKKLALLLDDLVKQEFLPEEVIVVDEDEAGSARTIVDMQIKHGAPYSITYENKSNKKISSNRNFSVELSRDNWVAFVNDIGRAPAHWLKLLTIALTTFGADGALGPVIPMVPLDAPNWIQRGSFYDWPRMETGNIVPLNKLRSGNLILKGDILDSTFESFSSIFGITSGDDGDLLMRLVKNGADIVWCDEAIVFEQVEKAQLSLRWLILRALHGGQDFARHKLNGYFGSVTLFGRVRLLLRAVLYFVIAFALMIVHIPFGLHRSMYWLLKMFANLGKMFVYIRMHNYCHVKNIVS